MCCAKAEADEEKVGVIGKSTILYFQLLKALLIMFCIFLVLCTPLFLIYSSGPMKDSTNSNFWQRYTIGNLGQSQMQCNQVNLRLYDYITLTCPVGTTIEDIEKIGL